MKNIHLIETDKPSRLHITGTLNLYPNGILGKSQGLCKNQHIYITSDEEIKKDWVYSKSRNKICKVTGISKWTDKDDYSIDLDNENYYIHHSYCKKIILTTDQDLIKDGVQPIDDDFLEWFVKNPSCKWVDQRLVWDEKKLILIYKIIIPKEEPKQETLEEAAVNFWAENAWNNRDNFTDGFIEGAKWQQERMYSEKELIEILGSHTEWSINGDGTYYEWFEQLKRNKLWLLQKNC